MASSLPRLLRTRTGAATLALSLACCGGVPPLQTTTGGLEWPRDLRVSQSDKNDILALAKLMGVTEPVKVSVGTFVPVGGSFVTVDGPVSFDGPQRSWPSAQMVRENRRGSGSAPPLWPGRHRVGRWVSVAKGGQVVRWRVDDGDWFVEVALGPRVSFADAQRIVLALRRGAFIKRIDNDDVSRSVPKRFEPKPVTSVERESGGTFSVSWPAGPYDGPVIEVAISDSGVELIAVGSYVI